MVNAFPMNKENLKVALGNISVIVSLAKIQPIEFNQWEVLCWAVGMIENEWPKDDAKKLHANKLCDAVRKCGILSSPYKTPDAIEGIVHKCHLLQDYLTLG
jgi:hypothetical protein